MIKALIVDDETPARKTIKSLLKMHCPAVNVCGEADGVDSAEKMIKFEKPELVFLDIKLQNETGFDLLEKFKPLPFKVIFITAFEEFAVKAFRFSALDYLLKPVQADELKAAVELASRSISGEKFLERMESFFTNINSFKTGEAKKIVLRNSDAIHVIDLKDLVRCEGESNYTTFYLVNGKKITISTTLKDYEEMLGAFGFIRTHQKHLVNLSYVEHLEKKPDPCLYLKDKTLIPVSTRKKEQVLHALELL